MMSVKELELAVSRFSIEELVDFANWFEELLNKNNADYLIFNGYNA